MKNLGFFSAQLMSVIIIIFHQAPFAKDSSTAEITLKDIDGNLYHTVKIGNQIWTVENLLTTRLNDGTPIAYVADDSTWESITAPAYCFYQNTEDPKQKKKFGALYNWYAVNSGKLAPKGWHVPQEHEFDSLKFYLQIGKYVQKGYSVGKALAAKTDWILDHSSDVYVGYEPQKNNRSGFTALPGGIRDIQRGGFSSLNLYGWWWTASETDSASAPAVLLFYKSDSINRKDKNKNCGLSVRLVKDSK